MKHSFKIISGIVSFDGRRLKSKKEVFDVIKSFYDYYRCETRDFRSQNVYLRNWSDFKYLDLADILKIFVAVSNFGVTYLGNVNVTSTGVWRGNDLLMPCIYIRDLETHSSLLSASEISEMYVDGPIMVDPYSAFL